MNDVPRPAHNPGQRVQEPQKKQRGKKQRGKKTQRKSREKAGKALFEKKIKANESKKKTGGGGKGKTFCQPAKQFGKGVFYHAAKLKKRRKTAGAGGRAGFFTPLFLLLGDKTRGSPHRGRFRFCLHKIQAFSASWKYACQWPGRPPQHPPPE